MQYSAAVANQAKVTFNELAAYITVISSVTRMSAETVGQSLKTMLTRLEQVKLGQMFEDDTTTISQVAKSLHGVGIEIMLTADTFRPMGDVLDELGNKWGTLTQKQQNAIAGTVAGIRQVPQFLTLMQNWAEVTKALAIETESAGLANERYAIYMQGVEAALNRSKAAWEGVWQATVESGAIKFFYEISAYIGNAVAKMGGLVQVVGTLLGVFVMLKASAVVSFISQLVVAFSAAGTGAKLLYTQLQGLVTGNVTAGATTNALTIAQANQALATNAVTVAQARLALAETAVVTATNALTIAQGLAVPSTTAVAAAQAQLALAQGGVVTATNAVASADARLILANTAVAASSKITWAAITGGISLIITAIMAVGLAYNFFGKTAKETLDEINAKIDEHRTKLESLKSGATSLADLSEEYEKLRLTKNRSIKQDERFIELQNEIQRILPQVSGTFNELGNYTFTAGINQATLNDLMREQIVIEQELLRLEIVKNLDARIKGLKDLQEEQDALNAKMVYYKEISVVNPEGSSQSIMTAINAQKELTDTQADAADNNATLTSTIAIMRSEYMLLTPELRQAAIEKYNLAGYSQDLIDLITKETAALDGQVTPLDAVADATAKLTDQIQQFSDALSNMSGMGGFEDLNRMFQDGTLGVKQYFEQLQALAKDTDLEAKFKGDTNAADTFFTELVSTATSALQQVQTQFAAGEISITDYISQIEAIGGAFETIGSLAVTFGSTLGLTAGQIATLKNGVDTALGDIGKGISELTKLEELNAIVQKGMVDSMNEGLQFGTETYNEYMELVAKSAEASGMIFTDLQGNAYKSADDIYGFLTAVNGNFALFANQTANNTGLSVQKIVNGIGKMLVAVSKAIQDFKGSISITPKQTGTVPFTIDFPKLLGGSVSFGIPKGEIDFETTGMGGGSKGGYAGVAGGSKAGGDTTTYAGGGVGNILEQFGQDLIDWTADFDSSIYTTTDGVKDANSAFEAFKDTLGSVASGFDSAGSAADAFNQVVQETIDLIKKEKQAEIDALEAKLAAYKKIIDAKKESLRVAKEEADFERALSNKQKEASDIEAELESISLDYSEEATARRLQLEADLAKKKEEIQIMEEDRSYDLQIEALDKEYATYEAYIEKKIAIIEAYLADTVQLMADALAIMVANAIETAARIAAIMGASGGGGGGSGGSGGTTTTTTTGTGFVEDTSWYGNGGQGLPSLHEGVDVGFVGGLKSNEEFAKLMDGELVINPPQMNAFMQKTLPDIVQNSNIGGNQMTIEMPIQVAGNLDKSVLPDIDNIVNKAFEKMNSVLNNRGYRRSINQVY